MRQLFAVCTLMAILPACANAPMPMSAAMPQQASMTAPTVDAQASRHVYRVDEIEGIGPAYKAKLNQIGITNTAQLLDKLTTSKERQDVADKTGISTKLLLSWANKADLMRIPGIGPQMSDLLEAIGINTVPQLAQRVDFQAIYDRMEVANNISRKFVDRVPPADTVRGWLVMSKKMDRVITY